MLKLLILATDPFMRLLVEREASEEVNLDKLEDIPIVWRYKSPITLDHLKKTLEDHAQHSDFKILRMFLKEVNMEIFVQSKGITYFLSKYHIYEKMILFYTYILYKSCRFPCTVCLDKKNIFFGVRYNETPISY